MARILAYTSPAIGHLYPMMPVLLELRRRGHDVHVRTIESQVDVVRAEGLAAEAIDPRIEPIAGTVARRSARAELALAVDIFTERAAIDGPDLAGAIDEVRPDLMIVDANSWGAIATAQAQDRPWVLFSPFVPPLPSPGTPPFGPGLRRRTDALGRLRDAVVGRLVFGTVERVFVPKINGIRANAGLPPLTNFADMLLDCDLMLVTTSTPFDYPNAWPAHVRSIGATPWAPPEDAPDWLADLPDPLVLVTTSSEAQADGPLVAAAVEGLGGEPGSVVVTAPAGIPPGLPSLPPNVRVVEFAAHEPLLARAAVAVTHGGMGATQKALAAGVPVVVVPFGRDQLETAARVVNADAGVRLSARRLSPARLRKAVRVASTKGAGARACAAGYAAAGGAVAAADAIGELMGARSS